MMKTTLWLTVSLVASACSPATRGTFCTAYTPIELSRPGAVAVVEADREAAERIAVNEELHEELCK